MREKKKSTAILLCLLGLIGLGGIHRFYLRRPWTGILYFFTYGLLWVGTIIDLIGLITGIFKLTPPQIKSVSLLFAGGFGRNFKNGGRGRRKTYMKSCNRIYPTQYRKTRRFPQAP